MYRESFLRKQSVPFLFKEVFIKGNIYNNAKTIDKDARFKSIAEIIVNVYL